MSRASGCVVTLKIVADLDVHPVEPTVEWEGRPFVYRQRPTGAPSACLDAEANLDGPRSAAVSAYGEVNHLNIHEIDPPHATIGIAASGTTFDAVGQALQDLARMIRCCSTPESDYCASACRLHLCPRP
jgi:indolepyruvate ferredoxin oxidoreductase